MESYYAQRSSLVMSLIFIAFAKINDERVSSNLVQRNKGCEVKYSSPKLLHLHPVYVTTIS